MSLPFLRGAAGHFDVTVVCRPEQAAIYRLCDCPLEVLEWEPFWGENRSKMNSLWSLIPLLRHLRAVRYEAAVSVWADVRLHLLLALTKAKLRVGLPMTERSFYASHLPWRKRQLRRSLQVARIIESVFHLRLPGRSINRESGWSHTDAWAAIGSEIGAEARFDTPWLKASPVSPEIAEFVHRHRGGGRKIWIVHPGARTANRRWPLEKFQRIIDEVLLPKGCAVLVFADQGEGRPFPGGDRVLPVSTSSLEGFVSVIGCADSILCNDSLAAHVGAAMGLNVWTLFTSGDITLFTPHGNAGRVLTKCTCEYRPCLDRCLKPTYECLDALDVEYVKSRLLESL